MPKRSTLFAAKGLAATSGRIGSFFGLWVDAAITENRRTQNAIHPHIRRNVAYMEAEQGTANLSQPSRTHPKSLSNNTIQTGRVEQRASHSLPSIPMKVASEWHLSLTARKGKVALVYTWPQLLFRKPSQTNERASKSSTRLVDISKPDNRTVAIKAFYSNRIASRCPVPLTDRHRGNSLLAASFTRWQSSSLGLTSGGMPSTRPASKAYG